MSCSNGVAFVTVGSTGFDNLISKVVTSEFTQELEKLGYSSLIVQYGSSSQVFPKELPNGKLEISGYDYKSTIQLDLEKAHLVISHAGSGSIIDALRMGKPLIVVVNETLMDNHQLELAKKLSSEGYLIYTTVSELSDCLRSRKYENLTPFPEAKTQIFGDFLDAAIGFS
ncbi:N-acetylglucosaminyldiphosphodolichol N-acetylglucosaminyltransferase catalytic subunit alg13 [Basidiobolus ranarum]|uniref:UDP-N-acetylglucosamine transferase subunit ALG13 n=1 Tax=Basidiobolus ranarum TaxID=34480 RepID=A0ABR2WZS0_9FUNG